MPLVTLSVQHGYTLEEARRRLETAVAELTSRFGTLVRRVEWSPDRTQVRLEGNGIWIELRLEGQVVHAAADIVVDHDLDADLHRALLVVLLPSVIPRRVALEPPIHRAAPRALRGGPLLPSPVCAG